MKRTVTQFDTYQYFYPYTVALFGARFQERVNFMTVAWHSPLSHRPPLFGVLVAKKRLTHEIVTGAGEFSVNFLGYDQAQLSANMGRTSGRNRDKVKEFRVTLEPGRAIASPIIAQAYAALECRLAEVRTYGDHDLFVGEVLAVQHEEAAFDDRGFLNTQDFPPLLYLGNDVYITVKPETRALVPVRVEGRRRPG
jgi:flavin reductase (DIM6/NTAB) family NADH-FMN oxidoreductase RutF